MTREEAARKALHQEYPWTRFVDDRAMVAAILADNLEVKDEKNEREDE